MQAKKAEKLRNRSGEYSTKAYQAFLRREYDKAGRYRTKAIQLEEKAKRIEERNNRAEVK